MVAYHMLHTFLVYGSGLIDPLWMSISKDILWVVIVCGMSWLYRDKLLGVLRVYMRPWLLFLLLVLWSGGMSYMLGVDPHTMLIGIKYDLRPVWILLSAVLL
jgi:hypothetical protein